MYKFWYDQVKPKYGEKAKLQYMDTDRFIILSFVILTDDNEEGKRHKECVIKRKLKFEDHTYCLEATDLNKPVRKKIT